MTSPIRPDSPRRVVARRFGHELERAIAQNRVSVRGLAASTGVTRTALTFYRDGVNLPSAEVAARLADFLHHPSLVAIAAEGRSGTCETCARPFVSGAGAGNRRYCSEDCRSIRAKRRSGVPVRQRAIAAERRSARYVAAVAAYCRACEPEGVCRASDCPLRVVSPLPVARRAVA